MKVFILLLILLSKNAKAQDEDGVLCSARSCSDYIADNPCPALPDNCQIQNSTHSGVILPGPYLCNCCQFCLINLGENEYCAVGEDGGLIPDSICGPGLTCSIDGLDGVCIPMTNTKCTRARAEYDNRKVDGTLGTMQVRPNCDDDGFYKPYKCLPGQTCFCVDNEGERIFGEIPYTSIAELTMKCECSRKQKQAEKFIGRTLHPNEYFRCTENGDYDVIQCIDDKCMCTDPLDGIPTYPTTASINMEDISNKTLDCFIEGVHETGKFYYACAESYLEILDEDNKYKANGFDAVFGSKFPNCTIDGKYAPIQLNVEKEEVFCADPDGLQIEEYGMHLSENTGSMNCNCARSKRFLPKDSTEDLVCCPNGNYRKYQCRRGVCYCVDTDGYQNGNEEVAMYELDKLSCYQNSCYENEI
ncbi:thyroglobulin-like [Tenebrio molitor]|uniref:thyroglobulin-like n=1 Tax=Tenebrio molitor TaxID=7067 RepID=UPI0036249C97